MNLDVISTTVLNVTRHYETGSAPRADVDYARVWLGYHFRFADLASRNLGLTLAAWTVDHYFRPASDD